MRSSLCFSMLQIPRCGMRLIQGNQLPYTTTWFDNLRHIGTCLGRTSVKAVSNKHPKEENKAAVWVNETKRLSQQESRKVYIRKNSTHIHTPYDKHSILGGFEGKNYVEEKIESQRIATILVFDIETTGFSRTDERIVEIAVRDLSGGENSTFQSLVNPECNVPLKATEVHGITTSMVNRADVPRFKDLLPILSYYIQSRRVENKPIILAAHNARTFDVPFLINEFKRCSEEIPSYWWFLDTLPITRQVAKLPGKELLVKTSLQALQEFYAIPIVGKAHRAMCDVDVLTRALQLMTMDLKLPVSGLIERTFKAQDIVEAKKKKK